MADAVPAIELDALTKDFAIERRGVRLRAVDHLTLRVAAGTVYGLLGPNGSGKSTTIKLLLGLLAPTSGTARLFGQPAGSLAARRQLGYVPDAPEFPRHLTGRELVNWHARLGGLRGGAVRSSSDAVLRRVGLADAADRRIGGYSKGMLQRLGLAQALVHAPRLLILDEPAAGLDPLGTAEFTGLIRELRAAGHTLLITSHLLDHMEEVCDRIAILDRGRLVAEGALDELIGTSAAPALKLDRLTAGEREELRAWFAARGRPMETVPAARRRLDDFFREHVAGS
jgi:ABC-2 type transport system ATP-binding protein